MNPTDPPQATENPTGELDVCYECGGQVRRVAGHGRTTRHRGVTYTIPADLALLTCQQCGGLWLGGDCLLYTSPSPRDGLLSRMPSSA